MRKFFRLLLITALLSNSSFAQDQQQESDLAVFLPTFMTGFTSFSAGTGFVVTSPNNQSLLFVTALHLFGPAGGLKDQLSAEEVYHIFHAVTGIGLHDQKKFVTSTTPLFLNNSKLTNEDGSKAGDLMVYRLKRDAVKQPFAFSEIEPKNGDFVFILGRPNGGKSLQRYQAEVIELDKGFLAYKFAQNDLDTAGTSGSPIVNVRGEIVGMHLGGGMDNGDKIGVAIPTSSMVSRITEAQQRRRKKR